MQAGAKAMTAMVEGVTDAALVCRTGVSTCALPLESVIETMRPLPVEPVSGAPAFVLGLSVVRGVPVPVIDASALVGVADAQVGRFVTVRSGDRTVALAVASVLGVRRLSPGSFGELPPLLSKAGNDAIAAVATLDAELLFVLRAARLVPEGAWSVPGNDAT